MSLRKPGTLLPILISAIVSVALVGCKDADSVNGDFRIDPAAEGQSGAVHISKMGDGIDVASAPHGADLSTMGGDIHIGDVASFAKVKTMGGTISIDHAQGPVDAKTMGGEITLGHVNGAIKATTMGGDIKARMVGSSGEKRDVELTSMGGTVELTVPKDFPMEVRITLTYTKNAPKSYEIVNHIGLDQRESTDWDYSHGSPRKYIRAQGRVGNGQNRVTINTINGDVILKQE